MEMYKFLSLLKNYLVVVECIKNVMINMLFFCIIFWSLIIYDNIVILMIIYFKEFENFNFDKW